MEAFSFALSGIWESVTGAMVLRMCLFHSLHTDSHPYSCFTQKSTERNFGIDVEIMNSCQVSEYFRIRGNGLNSHQ